MLNAGGSSFDDVLDVTMFFTDAKAQSSAIAAAYQKAFGEPPYQALTEVGATYLPGFDFETKVTLHAPSGRD